MTRIVVQVERPGTDLLAVKEALAMYCEQFGDIRLVDVQEEQPPQGRQMKIWTGLEDDCPW